MKKVMTTLIIGILILCGIVCFFVFSNRVPISKLYLNKENISLLVGESEKLILNIEPENATNKRVIWESNDNGVASVDKEGKVVANNEGSAIITVKTKDNEIYDYCIVNVFKNEIEGIVFKEENIEIEVDDSRKLEVNASLELQELFTWESSNEEIVKVDKEGKIYGIASGVATINIKIREKIVASKEVRIIIPVDSLSLENETVTIGKGDSEQLKFVITPEKAANQEVRWISDNEDIVSVKEGVITGKSEGEAIIKVAIGDKEASCKVKVIIPVTEIKLNKSKLSINRGDIVELKVTIKPNDATNKKITWKSSNEKIAKVDKNGKITGIGSGETTITATVDGKKATCKVTVTYTPITENNKYKKGYTTIASYNSDTLKYRIQKVKDEYYTLVWVENANKQWNSAFPKYGNRYPQKEILETEIKKYNYQNKGLVATNSSPFTDGWGDTPCVPFVMNKGNILLDIKNTEYTKMIYVNIGITEKGDLKEYKFTKKDYAHNQKIKQRIIKDGVRNTFATFAAILAPDKKLSNDKTTCDTSNPYCFEKTVLCQVDRNNFIIFSGGKSLSYLGVAYKLRDNFNCKVAYAYDGGSSSSLFYKTKSNTVQNIFNGQSVPDMMYFVEQ